MSDFMMDLPVVDLDFGDDSSMAPQGDDNAFDRKMACGVSATSALPSTASSATSVGRGASTVLGGSRSSVLPVGEASGSGGSMQGMKGGPRRTGKPVDLGAKPTWSTGGCRGGECNLLVAGLTPDVDDAALKKLFAPFGPIVSVNVMRRAGTGTSRGFGFVLFVNEGDGEAAKSAVHGTLCGSNTLNVHKSVHDGKVVETSAVFVRNLPPEAQEEDVTAVFNAIGGDVRRVALVADTKLDGKGNRVPHSVATVDFSNVEGARKAIAALHNSDFCVAAQRLGLTNLPPPPAVPLLLVKFAESNDSRRQRQAELQPRERLLTAAQRPLDSATDGLRPRNKGKDGKPLESPLDGRLKRYPAVSALGSAVPSIQIGQRPSAASIGLPLRQPTMVQMVPQAYTDPYAQQAFVQAPMQVVSMAQPMMAFPQQMAMAPQGWAPVATQGSPPPAGTTFVQMPMSQQAGMVGQQAPMMMMPQQQAGMVAQQAPMAQQAQAVAPAQMPMTWQPMPQF
jgi:hypothetical protein